MEEFIAAQCRCGVTTMCFDINDPVICTKCGTTMFVTAPSPVSSRKIPPPKAGTVLGQGKTAVLAKRLRNIRGLPGQLDLLVTRIAKAIETGKDLDRNFTNPSFQMLMLAELANNMTKIGRTKAALEIMAVAENIKNSGNANKTNKGRHEGKDKKTELVKRLRLIKGLPDQLRVMVERCARDIENNGGSDKKLENHVNQMMMLMQLGNALMAAGQQEAALEVIEVGKELNALL